MGFSEISEYILLEIFYYLSPEDLFQCEAVCKSWRLLLLRDNNLWHYAYKRMFARNSITPYLNWRDECYRLLAKVPCKEVLSHKEKIFHRDQVLHVCFSHNGQLFSTCSKDGFIKVWDLPGCQINLVHCHDMKTFHWKYTQLSSFNASDTLLLVSGVHFGAHSSSGEIAVFNLADDNFTLQCRIINRPYDTFGAWFDENHIISGNLHWFGHLISCSSFWINKAWQETETAKEGVVMQAFKFFNVNGSLIRNILVANVEKSFQKGNGIHDNLNEIPSQQRRKLSNEKLGIDCDKPSTSCQTNMDSVDSKTGNTEKYLIFTTGSYSYVPHQVGFKRIAKTLNLPSVWESVQKARLNNLAERIEHQLSSFDYNDGGGDIQQSSDNSNFSASHTTPRNEEEISNLIQHYIELEYMLDEQTNANDNGSGLFSNDDVQSLVPSSRIFSSNVTTARLIPHPDIHPHPEEMDFDSIDMVLEMHGHIVGLSLDRDNRWLYVNVRPWPENCMLRHPLNPPPMAQQCEIRVIDMHTLTIVPNVIYSSHLAYTPNDECYFLFMDSCLDFIASGSENKNAYIWDKRSNNTNLCVAKLGHRSVVNCVAFCPTDPEICISVGNDHDIKIWVSRRKYAKLRHHNSLEPISPYLI